MVTVASLFRTALEAAPAGLKLHVRQLVSAAPAGPALLGWYVRSSRERSIYDSADAFLVSFPKCGRTWLKLMLGRALITHFGLEGVGPLNLARISRLAGQVPRMRAIHDDFPQWKASGQLTRSREHFQGKRVVLLVRDIRDVVVSNYFQKTRRNKGFRGDLPSFLRHPIGSVDTLIAYYNIWAENRHVPAGFLLVRYEDLHRDAPGELRRVLAFLGVRDVPDAVIDDAVRYASFDNMRRMEREGAFASGALRPADRKDPESYKTRRGRVGGYVDYLSPEEIAYLDQRISNELSPFYGYQVSGVVRHEH